MTPKEVIDMKMTDKEIVRYIIKRLRKDSEKEGYVLSNHIFRYIRDYIDNLRDMNFLNTVEEKNTQAGITIDKQTLLRYYDVTRPEEISLKQLNSIYKHCKILLIRNNFIEKK